MYEPTSRDPVSSVSQPLESIQHTSDFDRSFPVGEAMSDHEEQVREAASVCEDAALEEMRRVVALRRSIEGLRVRAERDALIAEAERLAAGERVAAAARAAASTVPTSGQGVHSDMSQLSLSRPPKCET